MTFSFPARPNRDAINPIIIRLERNENLIALIRHQNQSYPEQFCYGKPAFYFDHRLPQENQGRRGIYNCALLQDIDEKFIDDNPAGLAACLIQRTDAIQVNLLESREHQWVLLHTPPRLKLLDVRTGDRLLRAGAVESNLSANRKISRLDSQRLSQFFYETYDNLDGIIYSASRQSRCGNEISGSAILLYERACEKIILQETRPFTLGSNTVAKLAIDLGIMIL